MGASSVSDPLADLAVAVGILASTSGSPAAIRVAEALAAWLAGSDCLEVALSAAPGCRSVRRFAEPETYEFADTVFRLVRDGFINAGSVGFAPIEWKFVNSKERPGGIEFIRQSLIEFSIVPVPANSSALVDGRSYRGRGAADDQIRELGGIIGRMARAARLRNALLPRRTTYAERVAIARELRRGH
jgi:hypothetical protein